MFINLEKAVNLGLPGEFLVKNTSVNMVLSSQKLIVLMIIGLVIKHKTIPLAKLQQLINLTRVIIKHSCES